MACVKTSSRRSSSSFKCVSRRSHTLLPDTDTLDLTHMPSHAHTPFHLARHDQVPMLTGAGSSRGRPGSMGGVRMTSHAYFLSADVSQFEAPDVVVMANNLHLTITAEKVCGDGVVSNSFTQRSLLPADVDLLGLSCCLTPEGMLVISLPRLSLTSDPSPFYSDI